MKITRLGLLCGWLPCAMVLFGAGGCGPSGDDGVKTGDGDGGDGEDGGAATGGADGPNGEADGGSAAGEDSAGGGGASGGAEATGGADASASGGGVAAGGNAAGGKSAAGGGSAATGGAASTGGASSGEGSCPTRVEGFGQDVTGGEGGSVVTARTGTEIHKAICDRADEDTPLTILVDGTITPGNTSKQSGSCSTADGVIELKEIENISLVGVGTRGVLDQVGIHIRASSNIIIQNLTIKNVRKENTDTPSNGGDAIGMESDVSDIWIDRNLIFGSTTEGEEHDGLIDMKDHTTDVTISCNHLHTGGRGGLVASSDSGTDGSTRITWHHNWYDNLTSRTHLVREAHGHFYNNYYSGIHSTGINSRNGATLLVEGNYFTESRNPLGTFFYTENPGVWEVHDNHFTSSVEWEAVDDEIPAGPNVQSTGSVSVPYQYTLDPAQDVPAIVMNSVGVGKLP